MKRSALCALVGALRCPPAAASVFLSLAPIRVAWAPFVAARLYSLLPCLLPRTMIEPLCLIGPE